MSALFRWAGIPAVVLALVTVVGCGGGSYAKTAESPGSYGGMAAPAQAPMAMERDEAVGTASEDREMMPRDEVAEAPGPPPAKKAPSAGAPPPPAPPPEATDATQQPARNAGEQPGVSTGSDQSTVVAPMLVYKASLQMAVYEAKKALDQTEKLARDAGGYLVRRDDMSITVRVPVGRFQGTLDAIMKVGDVLHRNVSVEDVTAEYTDLAIRLRNAEVVRKRLEELMAKANAVKDALEVERELARVTEEIERMKGRLKLLKELVAFSTITVTFQAQPSDHVDSTVRLPFPWLGDLGLQKLLSL